MSATARFCLSSFIIVKLLQMALCCPAIHVGSVGHRCGRSRAGLLPLLSCCSLPLAITTPTTPLAATTLNVVTVAACICRRRHLLSRVAQGTDGLGFQGLVRWGFGSCTGHHVLTTTPVAIALPSVVLLLAAQNLSPRSMVSGIKLVVAVWPPSLLADTVTGTANARHRRSTSLSLTREAALGFWSLGTR